MKKRLYGVFIALFLALCLFPLAGMLVFGPAQPAANETLATWPSLKNADGSVNTDYLEDISDYLGDRFALRQELVTLQHRLTAVLFHESGEDSVILGKDGWLFYADTLEDYEGVNQMSERQLWSAAHSLSLMQEYCREQGADFLFAAVPNKNSLYGEYMPDRYPEGEGESDLERLQTALSAAEVKYCDLYGLFQSQEDVLYRKQDSHWTQRGAALAADALLEALGREPENFFADDWESVQEEVGDLYEMVYPTGTRLDEDEQSQRTLSFSYVNPIRSTGDNLIYTGCEGKSGSLVMYRDSFGNTLHPFLAESFGSACFSRLTPYDLSLVTSQSADTVVVELVERNLDWLNTMAAVFPAPLRSLTETAQQTELCVSLSAETNESLSGYVKVSGSIEGVEIDSDSPIYLRAGETVYEATPAGDGEEPFTAYLPEAAIQETVTLLAYSQGQLIESQTILISD